MKKHNSTTKEELETIIRLDLEGVYQSEIVDSTGISQQGISSILNYYRGKQNATAQAISPHHKKLIDEIKKDNPIISVRTPKLQPCANKDCDKQFMQYKSTVKVCSMVCAIQDAKTKRVKQEAKEWRVERKIRKDKLETVQDLMKKAQKVFNTFIRLRDKDQPCISCDTKLDSKFDAGHYFSSGGHKAITFNEDNVHGQCVYCNQHRHGNLIEYQIGIEKRIGGERLIRLHEQAHKEYKPTREELRHLANFYKSKIKELNPK